MDKRRKTLTYVLVAVIALAALAVIYQHVGAPKEEVKDGMIYLRDGKTAAVLPDGFKEVGGRYVGNVSGVWHAVVFIPHNMQIKTNASNYGIVTVTCDGKSYYVHGVAMEKPRNISLTNYKLEIKGDSGYILIDEKVYIPLKKVGEGVYVPTTAPSGVNYACVVSYDGKWVYLNGRPVALDLRNVTPPKGSVPLYAFVGQNVKNYHIELRP